MTESQTTHRRGKYLLEAVGESTRFFTHSCETQALCQVYPSVEINPLRGIMKLWLEQPDVKIIAWRRHLECGIAMNPASWPSSPRVSQAGAGGWEALVPRTRLAGVRSESRSDPEFGTEGRGQAIRDSRQRDYPCSHNAGPTPRGWAPH